MQFDYETISALSRELGCKTSDLLALNKSNDPFYTGVARRKKAGEWFADLWQRLDWHSGMHQRRIHYILVSQDPPISKPDGTPYQNTDEDWKFLGSASLAARYDRLIPDNALVDRRNASPIINVEKPSNFEPFIGITSSDPSSSIELPSEIDLPRYGLWGYEPKQKYLVEVWIEKSTQNDILMPLASRLGFNLVPGTGETSEIFARQAVERAIIDGRPMRILYISDFDPGGRSMPVALARKIEFWTRNAEIKIDITLDPIMLTPAQCELYHLPRTPLKATENRASMFEERFGTGATELDALEALHPGELARIVETEVRRYIDTSLGGRVRAAQWRIQETLDRSCDEILNRHDVAQLQARYNGIRLNVEQFLSDATLKWKELAKDLRSMAPVIEDSLPEPKPSNPPDAPLFDSMREYIDQMDHYHRWQGKGGEA